MTPNYCACGCGQQANGHVARNHWKRLKNRDGRGNKKCPSCQQWKPETPDFFPRCGKRGFATYCKPCHVAKGTKNEQKRREQNPEYLAKRRKQWRTHRTNAYARDPIGHNDIKWRSALKLRKEMVDAYGGKCACCGETELEFLTLEHLFNDGKEHRERLGTGGGYRLWMDLKRKGWPQIGFTILCWNCHMSTCHGRPCPHSRRVEKAA